MPDLGAVLVARARALAQSIEQLHMTSDDAEERVERVLIRLESLYSDLIEIDLCDGVSPVVLSKVLEACRLLQESHEPVWIAGPGRPACDIPPSCIENLIEMRFTSAKIAAIFGVSRSTLCR